jgi:hypothetical protein
MRDRGARVLDMQIDPRDEATVGVSRRLAFQVEDVHTCYRWSAVPAA